MTTQTFPPQHHFVDIAPLVARFDVLTASVLAFIAAGQMRRVLTLTHKVQRVVKLGIKFDRQNKLLQRKLDMLMDKPWRERVLKQLGGKRRLRSWEAAVERNAKPRPKTAPKPMPVWLDTPERRAESERLKAHVRKCARACISPNVVRDRIRMDFEGEFRLPPIPRRKGDMRKPKIYTKASICDYFYNAMPYLEMKTIGPATVWPAEFRAAAKAEIELEAEQNLSPNTHPSPRIRTRNIPQTFQPSSKPKADAALSVSNETQAPDEGAKQTANIPTLRIIDMLSFREYNHLFSLLPEPDTPREHPD